MYRVDGSSDLTEEALDHFEGWRGSRPARIGNGAADQLQFHIYGDMLDAALLADSHGLEFGYDGWQGTADIVDWLCEHWDQPEEGIWETRGGRKDFTYGRFECWVAFDRDKIYKQVMHRGWNPQVGAFTQHYATEVLDSSLLLMPLMGFVAPHDPRWLSTLAAMDRELVSDSLGG
jgi:GH15 family glucan-1,4-alpha-glucosidase